MALNKRKAQDIDWPYKKKICEKEKSCHIKDESV